MERAIINREIGFFNANSYKKAVTLAKINYNKIGNRYRFTTNTIEFFNCLSDEALLDLYLNLEHFFNKNELSKLQVTIHLDTQLRARLCEYVEEHYNNFFDNAMFTLNERQIRTLVGILNDPALSLAVNVLYLQSIYNNQEEVRAAIGANPRVLSRFSIRHHFSTGNTQDDDELQEALDASYISLPTLTE